MAVRAPVLYAKSAMPAAYAASRRRRWSCTRHRSAGFSTHCCPACCPPPLPLPLPIPLPEEEDAEDEDDDAAVVPVMVGFAAAAAAAVAAVGRGFSRKPRSGNPQKLQKAWHAIGGAREPVRKTCRAIGQAGRQVGKSVGR